MPRSLSFLLATRYVRGKRSANAVPILSRISMTAIAVGSAALIILFSVFNGFEDLLKGLYKAFYPDLRISAAKGKFFTIPDKIMGEVIHWPGVAGVAPVLEDNVLINTEEEQVIAIVKGVENNYFAVNEVKPYVVKGRDSLAPGNIPTAILGAHIAARIGLDVNNDFSKVDLLYFNTKANPSGGLGESSYQSLTLKPDGIFSVQEEFDDKYIIAPLDLVQTLFNAEGKVSSLDIKIKDGADADDIKEKLNFFLGNAYKVETRYEQNKTIYEVIKMEKWATFAILVFILLIASVNMIGALSLLVLEKQKDMAILRAMGASRKMIRSVFIYEGLLWAGIGGFTGIILGGGLCWAQQAFGLVTLEGLVVAKYPVTMLPQDFFVVALTVLFVGFIAAWYPAMKATAGSKADEPVFARLR